MMNAWIRKWTNHPKMVFKKIFECNFSPCIISDLCFLLMWEIFPTVFSINDWNFLWNVLTASNHELSTISFFINLGGTFSTPSGSRYGGGVDTSGGFFGEYESSSGRCNTRVGINDRGPNVGVKIAIPIPCSIMWNILNPLKLVHCRKLSAFIDLLERIMSLFNH